MEAMTFFDYVEQFGTHRLRGSIMINMTPKLMKDHDWKWAFMMENTKGKIAIEISHS